MFGRNEYDKVSRSTGDKVVNDLKNQAMSIETAQMQAKSVQAELYPDAKELDENAANLNDLSGYVVAMLKDDNKDRAKTVVNWVAGKHKPEGIKALLTGFRRGIFNKTDISDVDAYHLLHNHLKNANL